MRQTLGILVVAGLLMISGCGDDPLDNAQVLLDMGKYDKVVEITDAAIMTDAKNEDAHLLKGRALLGMGEFNKADEAFADAVVVGGKSAAKKIEQLYLSSFQAGLEHTLAREEGDRGVYRMIDNYSDAISDPEIMSSMCEMTFKAMADRGAGCSKKDYKRARSTFLESRKIPADVVNAQGVSAALDLARSAQPGEENVAKLAFAVFDLFEGTQEEKATLKETLAEKGLLNNLVAKETMANIRTLATCFEAFAVDWGFYPAFSSREDPPPIAVRAEATQDFREWNRSRGRSNRCEALEYHHDIERLANCLEPVYVRTMPREDKWGNGFLIESTGYSYIIISSGSDGVVETDWYLDGKKHQIEGSGGETGEFETDIVYSNGIFLQSPAVTR